MPAEELSAIDEIAQLRKLLRQREAEIDFLRVDGGPAISALAG